MTALQRLRVGLTAVAVTTLVLAGLTLPARGATPTGSVKGVITLGGQPVKGLTIELHWTGDDGYENPVLAVDTTDANGAYAFTFEVRPGNSDYFGHTILIKDSAGRIVNTSRTFTDRPGRTVTRSAWVTKGGSITGTLARGDGRTTQQLRVNVFGPFDSIDPDRDLPLSYEETVRVAGDGSFALRGLPAGPYTLELVDDGQTYFPQCYDNVLEGDGTCNGEYEDSLGTPIRLGTGQHRTLSPQVLSTRGARISGTVVTTSGSPVRYAGVWAEHDGRRIERDGSAATGAFRVGPLADGSYRLSVDPPSPWAPQTVATAYDITGPDVTGVTIALKSLATVTATLTPGAPGTAKVAADVTRTASGGKPSGTVRISWGDVRKTVTLVNGKGTATLAGLPKGKRQITVSYSGTSTTAATSKLFYVTVT